jgi:hypothetical protein
MEPSNPRFRLADENIAGFIAEWHKEWPSDALRGDGRDVGIESVFGPRRSILTYERHPAVDNRVGMTGEEKSL